MNKCPLLYFCVKPVDALGIILYVKERLVCLFSRYIDTMVLMYYSLWDNSVQELMAKHGIPLLQLRESQTITYNTVQINTITSFSSLYAISVYM